MKDISSIARNISRIIENPKCVAEIAGRKRKFAPVVGVCGFGGSGKSTLINAMVRNLANTNQTIAVITCDPGEPGGGSLQGDIFRMPDIVGRDNVFIRAIPVNDPHFSIPPFMIEIETYLESEGFDFIIIETQGIAQSHYDIYYASDILIYVKTPEQGDTIQSIKRGVHHMADILFINKTDVEGYVSFDSPDNKIVIRGSALNGTGITQLLNSIFTMIDKENLQQKRYEKRLNWFFTITPYVLMQRLGISIKPESMPEITETPYKYALGIVENIISNNNAKRWQ